MTMPQKHPARLIARLEIKGRHVVKGMRMEGLRKIASPAELTEKYFKAGIDEIIYNDIVASLYGRNHLGELLSLSTEQMFLPLVAGGGVRSVRDFHTLLQSGADKVSLNTNAVQQPGLITEAAEVFGSQCVVVEIQAKKIDDARWEPYVENGRERTFKDMVEWAIEVEGRGAGEILLTSVDRDGTTHGLDVEMIAAVAKRVSIPVIAAGGAKDADDIAAAIIEGGANAVSVSHLLHFTKTTVDDLKSALKQRGIETRKRAQQSQ